MCNLIIVSKLFPRDRPMSSQSDINQHIYQYTRRLTKGTTPYTPLNFNQDCNHRLNIVWWSMQHIPTFNMCRLALSKEKFEPHTN
jgi:hypothetical protein